MNYALTKKVLFLFITLLTLVVASEDEQNIDRLTTEISNLNKKWLDLYMKCPQFMSSYDDEKIGLIADTLYWAVIYKLDAPLKSMSYEEIATFKPLKTMLLNKPPLSSPLKKIVSEIRQVWPVGDISFGLRQAALGIYIKQHSYQKFLEQAELFLNKSH